MRASTMCRSLPLRGTKLDGRVVDIDEKARKLRLLQEMMVTSMGNLDPQQYSPTARLFMSTNRNNPCTLSSSNRQRISWRTLIKRRTLKRDRSHECSFKGKMSWELRKAKEREKDLRLGEWRIPSLIRNWQPNPWSIFTTTTSLMRRTTPVSTKMEGRSRDRSAITKAWTIIIITRIFLQIQPTPMLINLSRVTKQGQ